MCETLHDDSISPLMVTVVATSVEEGSLKDGVLLETVAGTKISEETMRIIFLGLLKLARLGLRQPNLKAEVGVVILCCHGNQNALDLTGFQRRLTTAKVSIIIELIN